MARYSHGIEGPFKGKIGPVIGSSWQHKAYMKSLPNTKRHPTPSDKQKLQQDKFKQIGSLMSTMQSVVLLGFKGDKKNQSAYNNAMSYAIKNAIDTTTTPYSIQYDKLLVTRGKCPDADDMTAAPGKPGEIVFTWTDNTGIAGARADDKAVLIAYSPLRNRMTFTSKTATRSAGTATLKVDLYAGQTLETYMSFLRGDGTEVSTSIYTGQVVADA
jgi:hypothetical protein